MGPNLLSSGFVQGRIDVEGSEEAGLQGLLVSLRPGSTFLCPFLKEGDKLEPKYGLNS